MRAGEPGHSEDISDAEREDAYEREALEVKAAACGRVLHAPPSWAELDPRLTNVDRLVLGALEAAKDARGLAVADVASLRVALVDYPSELVEQSLARLRALGFAVRVGSRGWLVGNAERRSA